MLYPILRLSSRGADCLMTRRILLIDYESHSAERVRGVLREPDYEIVAAHDGEEALNI